VRILFDTNVLLRAHPDSNGPARRALLHAINCHIMISSAYILGELERVLKYPRVQRHFHLTPARVSRYVRELAEKSLTVILSQIPAQLLRDGTDASVVGTALSGGADVICTGDGDFFVE
jgi:putative PIN family toxin of toxin-antitoxin system